LRLEVFCPYSHLKREVNEKRVVIVNVVLWIIAALLALAFLAAGGMKLTQDKDKLYASGMAWTEDFSQGMVRTIGALEVLAAVGLVLPAAVDVVPVLAPMAALGLVALMVGAAITHARRREPQMIMVNLALAALAVIVVWGRFGPYSFTS
jgi:uncharacterized membrane protein YphA (DoxX/SURF4 family)